jgi:hypothetical protein
MLFDAVAVPNQLDILLSACAWATVPPGRWINRMGGDPVTLRLKMLCGYV